MATRLIEIGLDWQYIGQGPMLLQPKNGILELVISKSKNANIDPETEEYFTIDQMFIYNGTEYLYGRMRKYAPGPTGVIVDD